ncbi:MAG: methyltransferase domain-containing protein, partial [Anaerolineaceae bacterium]|nr:methyltransferase domain-containing protein [Anaerolineaceae bacterium]
PFPSNSFNLICCHFFLLWASPLDIILQEMIRVLQPGTPFIVFAEPDYGGRIDFPSELQLLGNWQERALRKRGAHTRIGRQLGNLLQQTGLTNIETGLIGGQWKIPQEANLFNNEWQTLEADLITLEKFDPVKFKQLKALATQYEQTGTRILFVPTFYAFGFKPAEKNK